MIGFATVYVRLVVLTAAFKCEISFLKIYSPENETDKLRRSTSGPMVAKNRSRIDPKYGHGYGDDKFGIF